MGDNVLISSWLPQTSLLAHRNVKVFVTHGGAGSTQETICPKTPIVGVPIFGDQLVNVKEAVNNHVGLRLEWHGMTEDKLEEALLEVLTNPEYQTSVDRLSNLIMDQPQHPLDRAVWWLEYLLRHPQHQHEAIHPQPLLVPVLPPVRLVSHSPHTRRHHSGCGQTRPMLLL